MFFLYWWRSQLVLVFVASRQCRYARFSYNVLLNFQYRSNVNYLLCICHFLQ
ncbi:hypothetical protein M758_1G301600 [Ceratodon purpureus]|uniref:Uncharacterized protein n=1 Tax=Ceratodon purpureus TaxID=3225 RepID=A0A8T0JCG5_CERPU|nr:hypothetical protein KC19_1G308000 [Ceratodon purpureus]KAG0632065.1 hypothetical protein M758_1G301600 [Ceratodon purpureus]